MKQQLIFIGPFPEPTHGQAIATEQLWHTLLSDGRKIYRVDTNGTMVQRILRHVRAIIVLLIAPPECRIYISVNANFGIYLTGLLCFAARLRGLPIALHHHTRSQLRRNSHGLRWLLTCTSNNTVHICLCSIMSELLKASADRPVQCINYSNVSLVDKALLEIPLSCSEIPLGRVVGHLSNLSMEKGLGEVLDTFRSLKAEGLADRLLIAGPATGAKEKAHLIEAEKEFGTSFKWVGPVSGEKKVNFFSEIDLFLFPSRYKNESQPLVNLEALAAGVPVVGTRLCCMESDLFGPSAHTVALERNFSDATVEFAQRLGPLSARDARNHFLLLKSLNEGEHKNLLAYL
ncbi:glycosyltransferase family 4 protein [Amaricoccus macauensis]|uniref:glycosyltransferase family 4 protein n=1 Tax=Amaricoccus macauensis TaxID=57001 RepID=UPI003C7B2F2E